jgi:hypothetical protein
MKYDELATKYKLSSEVIRVLDRNHPNQDLEVVIMDYIDHHSKEVPEEIYSEKDLKSNSEYLKECNYDKDGNLEVWYDTSLRALINDSELIFSNTEKIKKSTELEAFKYVRERSTLLFNKLRKRLFKKYHYIFGTIDQCSF